MANWDELTAQMDWSPLEPAVPLDALVKFEETTGLVLPDGLAWLEQQPVVILRNFWYWSVPSGKNPKEEAIFHAPSYSSRVTVADPAVHHWDGYVDQGYLPSVLRQWLPKFLVFWRDDFRNTYMLDYNFDDTCPPVVYGNWSEGGGLGGFADLDYVADSFEDFLRLPECVDGDYDTPNFQPPRPERVDEWQAWMSQRVAAAALKETNADFKP